MDNKTKEIVERLYTIAARLDDDAEASNYIDADMVASLHVAANLITRLSERVGELETEKTVIEAALDDAGLVAVWLGKDKAQIVCKPERFEHAIDALGLRTLLSKQEERVLNEQEQKVMQRALRNSVKFVNKQGEGQ